MFRCVMLLVALMVSTVAQAQVVPASGDPTYLAVTSTTGPGGGLCSLPYCVNPQQGIPLNYFATSSRLLKNLVLERFS